MAAAESPETSVAAGGVTVSGVRCQTPRVCHRATRTPLRPAIRQSLELAVLHELAANPSGGPVSRIASNSISQLGERERAGVSILSPRQMILATLHPLSRASQNRPKRVRIGGTASAWG